MPIHSSAAPSFTFACISITTAYLSHGLNCQGFFGNLFKPLYSLCLQKKPKTKQKKTAHTCAREAQLKASFIPSPLSAAYLIFSRRAAVVGTRLLKVALFNGGVKGDQIILAFPLRDRARARCRSNRASKSAFRITSVTNRTDVEALPLQAGGVRRESEALLP